MLRAHTKVRSFVRPPPIPVFHSVPTSWSGHSRGRRALSALRDGERAASAHSTDRGPQHTHRRGSHGPARAPRRTRHDSSLLSPPVRYRTPRWIYSRAPPHIPPSHVPETASEHARAKIQNTKKPSDCRLLVSTHFLSLLKVPHGHVLRFTDPCTRRECRGRHSERKTMHTV